MRGRPGGHPKVTREQARLNVGQEADRDRPPEHPVGDLLGFPFLECPQDGPPPLFRKKDATAGLVLEVRRL